MKNRMSGPPPGRLRLWLMAALAVCGPTSSGWAADVDEGFFERRVRPLLVERCHKCHAGEKARGGLRLDSRERMLKGGETGPAVVAGKPFESLLLQAVEQTGGLKMPPDGRLKDAEVAALRDWIAAGAPWPGTAVGATAPPAGATPAEPRIPLLAPDSEELVGSLQLWLRADSLTLGDGEPVSVWPDQSLHGRDVSATRGIRAGGVGGPGKFVAQSSLMGRPAVRFETTTGMASSPGNAIPVEGDSAHSLVLVMSLQRHEAGSSHDCVLCVGDPAHGGDPGRPLSALIEIDRTQDHSLDYAGGFGHDVFPGRGSFAPFYGKSIVLTIIKRPGPTVQTTRLFVNGQPLTNPSGGLDGRDEMPDLRHRRDVGVFLGKALGFCGPIQGDLGEVLIYNTALTESQRQGLERHLAEKYAFLWEGMTDLAQRAEFTDEERSFWAYQPVNEPQLPLVNNEAWVQTPVDRFVLRSMEDRGLVPFPKVDRRTLLRRVTLDLTGLPPTVEEMDAFLNDHSPQAYERVVERLLQSPEYGERWARHWLDLVRFAESTANDANAVMRYAWRYRNYVIDAFNADLPYDQFLTEQLAGDLMPGAVSPAERARRIIATGYLMVGPKALAETDKEQSRLDIVDDQIDVTGRAMLGLTLACARCHDHKFDAVRTTDYYAMAGVFRSTEPFMDENRNATMWWEFDVPQGEGQPSVTVMAPREAVPRNLRVHLRGNRFTLGPVVRRGMLEVVTQSGTDTAAGIDPQQVSSGRLELARWIAHPANPLTSRVMVNRIWQHHFDRGLVATSDNFGTRGERPTHPELLDWLARQFVQSGWSVKQMHRLIVHSAAYQQQSVSDRNTPSGDPEGRWLAGHRRRRMSVEEIRDSLLAVSGRLDRRAGTNESGEYLIEKAEGIGAKIRPNRVGADDPFYTSFLKRTIYLPVVRNMLPDVLALFDAADPNGVTAVRNETTVAPQSLFLMNNPLVRDSALELARRLTARQTADGGGLTDDQLVVEAHRQVLGRSATEAELTEARDFLSMAQTISADPSADVTARRLSAWQSYCQALLCSNEFLYVE